MVNCNVVRYLSALICIQLVSLTNLYLITISPAHPDDDGVTTTNNNKNTRTTQVGVNPVHQDRRERDQHKTREVLIAERDLLQSKLDQARRQITVKDRQVRRMEKESRAAAAATATTTTAESDQEELPPPQQQQNINDNENNLVHHPNELHRVQEQVDLLKNMLEEKDRKLKFAKEELKSTTYSTFLVGAPQTTGESIGDGGETDREDAPFLLHHLQKHRVQLHSTFTKYRVCRHASNNNNNELVDDVQSWDNTKMLTGCWLHAMDDPWFSLVPARRFVVLRNPRNHVPALYQHCVNQQQEQSSFTDGNPSISAVPDTLDAWLEINTSAEEEEEVAFEEEAITSADDDQTTRRQKKKWIRKRQNKRKPRRLPTTNDINDSISTMDECQFQHVPANPQARRILHGVPSAFKDDSEFVLKNLYHTVGLTDELFRTACLFSIAIHHRIPPQCDCSNGVADVGGGEESDAERDGGENNNVDKLDNKTPLYDDTMEITEEQGQAIRLITEHDQELYDTASRLFWEEVARVQHVYAFRLC